MAAVYVRASVRMCVRMCVCVYLATANAVVLEDVRRPLFM